MGFVELTLFDSFGEVSPLLFNFVRDSYFCFCRAMVFSILADIVTGLGERREEVVSNGSLEESPAL